MKLLIFIQLTLTTYAFVPDYFSITKPGNQFQPANIIELLAINSNIRTLIRCAILCDRNIQCRTFDYDSISKQCRLFEGSIDTGILLSVSSASVVGNASSPLTSSSTVTTTITKTTSTTSSSSSSSTSSSSTTSTTTTKTTSSTSTSSSSSTTSTTSLSTSSSSTSTTTAMSTVAPPCPPQSVSNGTLLYLMNPTSFIYPNYTCYAYTWTATALSATLSFFFRHDPGSLTGWNHTGNCGNNYGQATSGSSYAKSGSWYYYDPCAGYIGGNMTGDTISQTFSTIAGGTYTISFWLTNYDCCNHTEIANITLI
ncbi:unnamed protein product [Adineta steineri]|uniref:Apple domain-containing protein n=1 Tax=Adineta steineri TaxID=433720 RepID=A0A814I4S7_9BILA|nr:unnamed protein product [Adineta steineri]CAF1267160.1 unnamed protein product [Adineta steineri]